MNQQQLIFVISPPRAGSTLLQRMLGSHADVFTHPEPHLITPLAHLGYDEVVDAAPYDHINAAESLRLFVSRLPGQEADYYEALRKMALHLYGRMLETSEARYFLDKTPAYALVLPFLEKLFPEAKYVVLTRHPLAVFSSYASSFFEGDWGTARAFNPVVERYVPAMARFLRDADVPKLQVSYEQLVAQPEEQLARIFAFLGIENDPGAVNYGERFEAQSGRGDPMAVHMNQRPVASSTAKWAEELARDTDKLHLATRMVEGLSDEDLETWGYPRESLFEAMRSAGAQPPPKRVLNRHTLQRRIFLAIKKDIDKRPHGRLIRRAKYYCDVLLRDSL